MRLGGGSSRSAPNPLDGIRVLAPWAVMAAASVFAGAAATGKAAVWFGETPSLLLVAALAGSAIFLVFAFVGSAVVVVWPVAATAGYLLQLPRSHPIITFDRLWIGAMLAYILLERRSTAPAPWTRRLLLALIWLVISFGVRAIATEAGTAGPAATWLNAIVLPTILFVACERYCSAGRHRVGRLMGSMMIAGGILGGVGIAQRIWGFELASLTGGAVRIDAVVDQTRVSGPYPAPEPYALTLIVCFAATLYWIQAVAPRALRIWGVAFAGLELAGIALSLFRAAWIGALIVLIASVGLRPGRFGRTFAVTALMAALALTALPQLERNTTFAARAKDTQNIYGRLATYQQGIEIFRSAPVFGVGVDRYHKAAEVQTPVVVSEVESVTYAHNSYLGLLAEQGLIGFLPLLLVSYAVWQVVRTLRRASVVHEDVVLAGAVTGAAIAYLIMSLTLTMLPYQASNTFFAALLGAACARLDALSRPQHRLS